MRGDFPLNAYAFSGKVRGDTLILVKSAKKKKKFRELRSLHTDGLNLLIFVEFLTLFL